MDELIKSRIFWFVIGAFLTILAAWIKSHFERVNVNKQLFLENVTTERSKWRESLRGDVSEFCSLVYKIQHDSHFQNKELAGLALSNHIARLSKIRVKVRLKLNPNVPMYKPDAKIVRSMSRVLNLISVGEFSCIHREMLRIERSTQKILKAEWEKSKDEAIVGKLR
ncbi:hypothetical protein [Shewanella oncorhynchi]|uniref:hypothetical protein n=1 Tax=Shewanella oncorhynchi TaxID=2726434 RepID=UPI002E7B2672|nr:hypothetical protein [Shewanella oncorhynchi]WVI92741.1 hypothetical protein VR487_18240 [Shewanella oncorhynchi]